MRAKPLPVLAVVALALFPSCAGHHMRMAEEAYDRMSYRTAGKRYDHVLKHGLDRTALIHCADACRRQNELEAAALHYHQADSIAELTREDAFRYGQVLMGIGREHDAEGLFFRVLQEQPEHGPSLDLYCSCAEYKTFLTDTNATIVNRLELPGYRSVFSAVPYKKGLLVTGEQAVPKAKANPWNGQSFLDLYYSEKNAVGTWLEPVRLPGTVNGPYHEGPAVITPDGKAMYFTRSNYYERRLYKDAWNTSHLKLFRASLDTITGAWTDIREFAYNGEAFSTGHPAISPDGRTLYFASDRPGGSGGSDIWRSRYDGGAWSPPENLGPTVNTAGQELFPVVNGEALYFSSDAHQNLGGLDIFEVHEIEGGWSDARNLKYPVNTEHDDFSLMIDPRVDPTGGSLMSGYLSSNRSGADRVHTFRAVAPTFFAEGVVTDEEGRFLPNAEVTLAELLTNHDTAVATGPDGKFSFALKAGSDYTVRVADPGHFAQSRPISTRGLLRSDTLHVDIRVSSIAIDQPIMVDNIRYDPDKWDIRPDAAVELDKLARIFKDNPNMTFEIAAHTDSRGADLYNLVLSEARANSAVNYLIQQGVEPDHISARGFGETVPVNKCVNGVHCSEEEHQANRRTEFRITGVKSLAQKR